MRLPLTSGEWAMVQDFGPLDEVSYVDAMAEVEWRIDQVRREVRNEEENEKWARRWED